MFERLTNSITFGQMFTKITLPLAETNFALFISTSGLEKKSCRTLRIHVTV